MKLLVVYDHLFWAYHRRAAALEKYAPADWEVRLGALATGIIRDMPLEWADVVFLLDYACTSTVRPFVPWGTPMVVSFNADARRRQDWWPRICDQADYVVCVSRERYEQRGEHGNCCYIPNGVDCGVFRPTVPWGERPNRVLWCGRERMREVKGYDKVLVPLKGLLEAEGFECDFRLIGHTDDIYDTDRMVEWYNSGRYVVSASRSEGTANTLLEGAACGCVPIACNSAQYAALWCDATPEDIRFAIQATEDRPNIGTMARDMAETWHYAHHARHYFGLFRQVLEKGTASIKAFAYDEVAA